MFLGILFRWSQLVAIFKSRMSWEIRECCGCNSYTFGCFNFTQYCNFCENILVLQVNRTRFPGYKRENEEEQNNVHTNYSPGFDLFDWYAFHFQTRVNLLKIFWKYVTFQWPIHVPSMDIYKWQFHLGKCTFLWWVRLKLDFWNNVSGFSLIMIMFNERLTFLKRSFFSSTANPSAAIQMTKTVPSRSYPAPID